MLECKHILSSCFLLNTADYLINSHASMHFTYSAKQPTLNLLKTSLPYYSDGCWKLSPQKNSNILSTLPH